jgi:hypothetical protein
MSPFLTTLGGGSTRGFGRAFRRITALLGPTSAPTSLSAPSIAGTSVQLSWTNTDNISQIRVYRGATLVTTLSAASTTYTNTGLSPITSYSFTVKYFKDAIEGSASNAVSITTLSCPSAGTQVSYYCSGCTAYVTYNDGNCGTYQSTESNSAQCCAYLGYDVGSLGSVSGPYQVSTGVYGEFCSTGAYPMAGIQWIYRHSTGQQYAGENNIYGAECSQTQYSNLINFGLVTVTIIGRFDGLDGGGQPSPQLGGGNTYTSMTGYTFFTISSQGQFYF